jgi:transposase
LIGSTRNLAVWAYPEPADLRNGYDGLSAIVVGKLGRDPLSGDCYLFTNRTRTRAKVLVWDGTGLCIYQKRLEQGRFAALWQRERGGTVELTMSELALFLEGSRAMERVKLSPARFMLGAVRARRRKVAAGP